MKRLTKQQKYELIMECRSSGYSDYMWCKQQGIRPSTFYGWVQQLKKANYQLPHKTGKDDYTSEAKPDIVKLEIVDEVPAPATTPLIPAAPLRDCGIEINIGKASIKVFNDVNPKLLSQVISCLGGVL